MPANHFSRLIALSIFACASAASAQNTQAPTLVPGLEGFTLPGSPPATQPVTPPAAVRPTPVPTPTPTAAPRKAPAAPVARPTPRPTPLPATTPAPVEAEPPVTMPAPLPTPVPTTPPAPSLVAEPIPTPTPVPAPIATSPASDPTGGHGYVLPVIIGLLAAAFATGAYFLWSRRRRLTSQPYEIDVSTKEDGNALPIAEEPSVAETVAATPAIFPETESRALLELTMRPVRAGTNLTSAAVDYEIEIHNTGDRDAIGVLFDLRLLSASADQDTILSALYAAPIDKPAVAPFDIVAGQKATLAGMAMLPRGALNVMSAQGREFFVPLLSLNAVYGWGDTASGQTANAYVIGIEQTGVARMAPFRLDTGPRMFDRVGARLHSLIIRR